jgi:hypothetical protein
MTLVLHKKIAPLNPINKLYNYNTTYQNQKTVPIPISRCVHFWCGHVNSQRQLFGEVRQLKRNEVAGGRRVRTVRASRAGQECASEGGRKMGHPLPPHTHAAVNKTHAR